MPRPSNAGRARIVRPRGTSRALSAKPARFPTAADARFAAHGHHLATFPPPAESSRHLLCHQRAARRTSDQITETCVRDARLTRGGLVVVLARRRIAPDRHRGEARSAPRVPARDAYASTAPIVVSSVIGALARVGALDVILARVATSSAARYGGARGRDAELVRVAGSSPRRMAGRAPPPAPRRGAGPRRRLRPQRRRRVG